MRELEDWLMAMPLDREIFTIGRWALIPGHEYRVGIRQNRKHPAFGYGSTLSEAAVDAIRAINSTER